MQIIIGKYHIQISKFAAPNKERSYKLSTRRRKKGLCRQCGKKVTRINSRTKLPYTKCDKHRQAENKRTKLKNLKVIKNYDTKQRSYFQ